MSSSRTPCCRNARMTRVVGHPHEAFAGVAHRRQKGGDDIADLRGGARGEVELGDPIGGDAGVGVPGGSRPVTTSPPP